MLKVLIVDDETVVRRGIVLGVDWASMDCVVVGEAANGEEGLAAAERYNPNLIACGRRNPPPTSSSSPPTTSSTMPGPPCATARRITCSSPSAIRI